ncbi:MAG: hypothetical protein ACFB2W_26020 [Leptolyngbyaceae cyanobacterium]
MGMELWEIQQEEVMSAYYEEMYENELKERAIEEFTAERLSSYYFQHPNILQSSFSILKESKLVAEYSASASLLLSCSSIEVSIKAGILKPIIYGLVHSEMAAEIIAETAIKQTGLDRFRELLAKLVNDIASLDIQSFKRNGSTKILWKERQEIQVIRNKIIHKAERCDLPKANFSISVADSVLNELIPNILSALNLEINPQCIIVKR